MFDFFATTETVRNRSVTFAEIEARAHRMRSEAIQAHVAAAFRGIGGFLGAFLDAMLAVRVLQGLCRLDDAGLARLGLRREDLPTHVFQLVNGAPAKAAETGLEAIPGGRAARPSPVANAVERHAA